MLDLRTYLNKTYWSKGMVFFIFCVIPCAIYPQFNIKGHVYYEGKPTSYCTVAFFHDSVWLRNVISDKEGRFEVKGLSQGNYQLKFSHVSYEGGPQYIQLRSDTIVEVVLKLKSRVLAEVKLNSKKPFIEQRPDRFIVNVENSILAVGYSALEVIQRSPGLWVSNDGDIKLRGNQSVNVMLDGILQRMPAEALAEFLSTIRSENILRIEVLTSPGAEYDAEGGGGFINIVLKKPRVRGLTGGVFFTYKQQERKPYIGPSMVINVKEKNKTFTLSYVNNYDASEFYAINNVHYPDNEYYNTFTLASQVRRRNQVVGRMVLEMPKKQLFIAQYVWGNTYNDRDFNTEMDMSFSGQPNSGNASSLSKRKSWRNSITLNYVRPLDTFGTRLSFIADYTYNKSNDEALFKSRAKLSLPDSGYRNFAPFSTHIATFQVDFRKLLGKVEFKTGAKYSYIERNNKLFSENMLGATWLYDPQNSNHFLYNENIGALYLSFEKSFNKTQIQAGLRGELTDFSGKSLIVDKQVSNTYFGLFPSLNILRTLNKTKGHSIGFTANRRLSRPDFNELNPYRLKIDNFTYQIGNPALLPQYSYNLSTTLTLANRYVTGVYYTKNTGIFISLASLKPNNILEYQLTNYRSNHELGVYVNVPIDITKWWTTQNECRFYLLKYQLPNFENTQTTFFVRTLNNINIKKFADIDIVAEYRSPYVYANADVAYQFYCDMGISKKIIKNKIRARLLVTDVFNSLRDKVNTDFVSTQIYFYQKRPTRTFGLTFSYTFSTGSKFTSRNAQQNNEEERNRLEK